MRLVHSLAFLLAIACAAPLASATLITFDDIPAGFIGDQYLTRGVRFYVGNGDHGAATGLRLESGLPVSAYAGSYGTSVSQPNVMNAGQYLQSDIYVYFYDATAQRTTATSVGVQNDVDGTPALIYIEGFDVGGASLGKTTINGGSQSGTFSSPGIYAAKIWSAPSQNGVIGVDNFQFSLTVPEPAALSGMAMLALALKRWRN